MSTTTSEIDDYVTAVHAALADLPDHEREDLLDDLPQHLADVQADRGGTLVELIGTPEAYAAELRATAGLDAKPRSRPWSQAMRHQLARADTWVGSALNYERSVDLLRELAPGWWLVRAYLIVQVCTHAKSRFGSHALVPQIDGSRVTGVVVLVAACAGSVWLGRRGFRREWQRVVSVVLGLALLSFGVVLVRQIDKTATVYVDSGYTDDGTSGLSNIYPVGPDGTVLKNIRLYDQDGNPVQLGDAVCADAADAPEDDGAYLYPLMCATDQGPFGGGGPTALPTPSSAAPSSPASPAATSSPSVSSAPGRAVSTASPGR